jgi:PAS domain S-box-containing protein
MQAEDYRQVLEVVDEGIIVTDTARNIVVYNSASYAIFGYTPSEIIGRPFTELFSPYPTHHRNEGTIRRFMDDPLHNRRRSCRGQVTAMRNNGETFPAVVSALKLKQGGEFYLALVIRDITFFNDLRLLLVRRIKELEHSSQAIALERERRLQAEDLLERLLRESKSFESDQVST